MCWKTNQSTRTNVVINALNIKVGKTVNIDWGDGTNADYTGNNTNITKTYAASAVNVFNIKISGDTNSIATFNHNAQSLSYGVVTNWVLPASLAFFVINSTGLTGVVTNWVLPASLTAFYIHYTGLTGVVTNWVLPASLTAFYIHSTDLTGSLPQITAHATNGLSYQAQTASLSDSKATVFRKGMTVFNISNQKVPFLTDKIDKVLKALADWYQNNAPTANCTYNLSGTNMGIPTGGASNVDIVRLSGYFTTAGFTAIIIISS
ncbi:MAG: hypothetical protein LLF83_08340 [Methanobacterium sp.]|nr:hypothetical protein [Methanobacterium sp.]